MTAANTGNQDARKSHVGCPGARPWHFEDPDADACIDQEAQLGDGEADTSAHPRDQAKQGQVADAEQ